MKKEKDMYWQRFLETGQIADYLQYRRRKEAGIYEKQKDGRQTTGIFR